MVEKYSRVEMQNSIVRIYFHLLVKVVNDTDDFTDD